MILASVLLMVLLLFISHFILTFSNMVAQVLDREIVEIVPDSPEIFSINQDDVARLNRLFYEFQDSQAARFAAVSSASLGVGLGILAAGSASAQTSPTGGGASNAAEAAADSIAAGVTNAINMIQAIDGIGLAAFGVALAPMGFMVTLRVLNMVLSRV